MTLNLPEHRKLIDTERFGPFALEIGVDTEAVEALYTRVQDAQKRFRGSPLSQVARNLEREIVVTSIFGTNSIEGGTLSEEETQLALELDPADVQSIEQRRAVNIKRAYDLSREAASNPEWHLDLRWVKQVHATITHDLPHEHDAPGQLRDNPRGIKTQVGTTRHGGIYRPPQSGRDIKRLVESLFCWHTQIERDAVPALIRAPLVHYYFELIHPFWDGNGRVGRVLEATILGRDGFKYAPFAQARFYLENLDRYFALFNACRKAGSKTKNPNTEFVEFFLEGMLDSINKLHDRVNRMVDIILFENHVKHLHDERKINARQYAIVSQVLTGGPLPLANIRREPWYVALYTNLTDKTKQRDLRKLREQRLLTVTSDNRLLPGFSEPG